MKKFKKILMLLLLTLIALPLFNIRVDAVEIKTIKVGNNTEDVLIDPVTYERDKKTFEDTSNKTVLYTPNWHYETTNNEDDVIEYVAHYKSNATYEIKTIHETGNQVIPLNGVVLSVPKTHVNTYSVGDLIDVLNNSVNTYDYAIKGENGTRLPISSVNSGDTSSKFVYFNRIFGRNTGTNSFSGNEVIARYSNTLGKFVVETVDAGGNNEIPKDGFVIATTGRPNQFVLNDGVMFNEGDVLELVGLDFIQLEETITKNYTAIGGTRYAEYLNVYPANLYPTLKSGQNVHGYEVAVDESGIVVAKDVLVDIPENGFVLSGHGSAHQFLLNEIDLGDEVSYTTPNKLITIKKHLLNQTVFAYELNRKTANDLVNDAILNMYDVNDLEKAEENLNLINSYVDKLIDLKDSLEVEYDVSKLVEFLDYKEMVYPIFDEVYFDTLISRRIETRGIWHRPFEKTLSQIEATLDELVEMNFTDVYVETFWNGYTVYKSDFAPYHEIFVGADFGEYDDYLKAFIAEAEKRNINVHAWVENFFVGVSWQHSNLWNEYADWRIVDINGNNAITGKPGGDEEGFLFFDPANPEAREFVINIYKEIIEHDFVGLQLDYIRYPSGNENVNYSTGYTEYAMNEFKDLYDIEGDVVALVKSDSSIYAKWNQYRQNVINTFVERIHNEIRPLKDDLMLSIAVGPDHAYAKINLMQDWNLWVQNGWIDIVKPMAYVNDVNTLTNIVRKSKEVTGNISYNYTGISPVYDGLPDIYNASYTDAINKNGAQGSAFFATHNYRGKQNLIHVIKNGTYKNKSISADAKVNDILDFFIEDLELKYDNVYIRNNGATIEQKNDFINLLNKLREKQYNNPSDFKELYEELDKLSLELVLYGNEPVRERLDESIKYFMEIIDIRTSRYLINNNYWDPVLLSERPDADSFEYPVVEEDQDDETPSDIEDTKDNNTLYVILGVIGGIGVVSLSILVYVNYKNKKN